MMDDGSSDEDKDDSFGWLWQGRDGVLVVVAGVAAGCDWGWGRWQ